MTILMDRLFIKIEFDSEGIQNSSKRGILYIGMIYLAGMATAFIIMAALS